MNETRATIRAAEALIRELKFHEDAPRPARVAKAVRDLQQAIEALPAEMKAGEEDGTA